MLCLRMTGSERDSKRHIYTSIKHTPPKHFKEAAYKTLARPILYHATSSSTSLH